MIGLIAVVIVVGMFAMGAALRLLHVMSSSWSAAEEWKRNEERRKRWLKTPVLSLFASRDENAIEHVDSVVRYRELQADIRFQRWANVLAALFFLTISLIGFVITIRALLAD